MGLLKTDGAEIYYEVLGQGTRQFVTLLNGHTRSSSDFRFMARGLMEQGLDVIILDNRGSGKTSVTRPFTIQDMCRDVVAIWDELRVGQSALLGISMGGFISQGVAIQYPDRVRKLVLVSTAPEDKYINSTGGGWINDRNMLEQKMRSYFAPGFVERNPLLFETMIKQIIKSMENGDFAERSNSQRQALKHTEWTSKINQIKCPTLIVHGEKDQVIDVSAARLLHAEIENSSVRYFTEAGHLLLAECPKEFYKVAIEFIKSGE